MTESTECLKTAFEIAGAIIQAVLFALLILVVRLAKKGLSISKETVEINDKILGFNRDVLNVTKATIAQTDSDMRERFRPRLVAYIEKRKEENTNLFFIIDNEGKEVAEQLDISFPNISSASNIGEWSKVVSTTAPIRSIPPGYRFSCPIGRAGRYVLEHGDEEEAFWKMTVRLEYQSVVTREIFAEVFQLDLSKPVGTCSQ